MGVLDRLGVNQAARCSEEESMETSRHREPPELEGTTLAEPGVRDASPDFAFSSLRTDRLLKTLRKDAEFAATVLSISTKPAVLLVKEWHALRVPFAFEHLGLFQEIAARFNFTLVALARPEAGGFEHLLLMAQRRDLLDQEYLDCI